MQKAISECEEEWADNKKLIDLSKKGLRFISYNSQDCD